MYMAALNHVPACWWYKPAGAAIHDNQDAVTHASKEMLERAREETPKTAASLVPEIQTAAFKYGS